MTETELRANARKIFANPVNDLSVTAFLMLIHTAAPHVGGQKAAMDIAASELKKMKDHERGDLYPSNVVQFRDTTIN